MCLCDCVPTVSLQFIYIYQIARPHAAPFTVIIIKLWNYLVIHQTACG